MYVQVKCGEMQEPAGRSLTILTRQPFHAFYFFPEGLKPRLEGKRGGAQSAALGLGADFAVPLAMFLGLLRPGQRGKPMSKHGLPLKTKPGNVGATSLIPSLYL